MFSHRIKNAIKFGTEARGFIPFTEEELRDMAEWLDAHPADGTYDQYLEERNANQP